MITFIFSFVFLQNSLALTPEEVVRSSMDHFPQVIQGVQGLEIEKNKVEQARGAFDGKLKGDINGRAEGFYDGDAYEVSAEKPIPYFNSKIYGGRRQSFGQFPSYEGKYETLSDGESFAGVSVSLLRDSLIDANRYNLRYRKQDLKLANINVNLIKMNVQTMALKAYWTWFVKGHELAVYKSILNLAQIRAAKINKRIKAGDLARIYGVENNQYILKRSAQVEQKKLEFQKASFYLSLFYRNLRGEPILMSETQLPEHKIKFLEKITDWNKIYDRSKGASLDLKMIEAQKAQAQLDVRMGNNDLLPKLDVNYEWSQDDGVGSSTLTQQESRVMLKLEVPIEYRKGLGKKRAGKAKLDQLETKRGWLVDKLKAQVQTLVTQLNSFAEIFKITSEQVSLSEKLAQAELKKFARGASDLILVNIREETLAETQVKNLSALLKYYFVEADLRNIQVDLLK